MKYFIAYGLGGGFGGASNYELIEEENEQDANMYAYDKAMECYDSHAGYNGLRSIEEIMDEDGYDHEEAEEQYNQEAESWLDYSVEVYDPDKHDDLL